MSQCAAALGRMSVACGPASMLLPTAESSVETETSVELLRNKTYTTDALRSSVNVTAPEQDSTESRHPDQFGKIATVTKRAKITIRYDTYIHTYMYIQTLDNAHNSQAQGLNLRRGGHTRTREAILTCACSKADIH